jgi:hypothetical protein
MIERGIEILIKMCQHCSEKKILIKKCQHSGKLVGGDVAEMGGGPAPS